MVGAAVIILLSSLANERIDDDLSRHIGLKPPRRPDRQKLFRSSPSHAVVPIATGLLFTLQVLYERTFDQEHRGRRDLPRRFAYVGILLAVLVAEAASAGRSAAPPARSDKRC